ncbi:hypothetical protein AGABI2DRAFT_120963 [Agaricus bisporus var. bisporus H97]|uniref:hypothetical protein n=1 Tax=Agaricus bisporus var. bisporus (strain H97 / ATCC MYA-4626 / FGSC 10389) TaxID=936046 RepID=UPI00029F6D0E|nr:hypothetical protein AGABI2DRAFT_120963 [Agaricus bisporus var. bisporus H97]EKV44866.1 hypothetical protein AGABI2DRAFT_120963 [Agaricus bisporus var. bisporus H97]
MSHIGGIILSSASLPNPHIYVLVLVFITSTTRIQAALSSLSSTFILFTNSGQLRRSPRSQWPSEQDLWKLANASGGLFVYADAVIKYVGDPVSGNPTSQLNDVLKFIDTHPLPKLPQEQHPMARLDALYAQILSKVPERTMVDTRKILLALVSDSRRRRSAQKGSFLVFCNWLGMTCDDAYAAIRHLRSLLYAPGHDEAHKAGIRSFHKSFLDYISDFARSGFSSDAAKERVERKKEREGSGGGGEERRHEGRKHFPFFFCALKRTHARSTWWYFVSKKGEEPSDQAKRSCTALQFKVEETRLEPFDILGEEGKGKKDDRNANATIESEEEDGDHGSRWRSRCRFKQQGLRPNKGHNADDSKESNDPEATKVKNWQHKLQKTFLSSKGISEDEFPPSTICSPQREL